MRPRTAPYCCLFVPRDDGPFLLGWGGTRAVALAGAALRRAGYRVPWSGADLQALEPPRPPADQFDDAERCKW